MYQITEWCRHFIREQVRPGDLCIDATMGNGNDTDPSLGFSTIFL